MPTAVQNCQGSLRLVPIKRFRDDDRSDCPSCNARPKCTRRKHGLDLYYEVPAHRPDGVRSESKIDWSQV